MQDTLPSTPDQADGLGKASLVLAGANATFLITTLAQVPNSPAPYFPGSYAVFLVLTLANLVPVGWIALHSAYRSWPWATRVNLVFRFLALEWVSWVAFGLELVKAGTAVGGLPRTMVPIFVAGLLLFATWKTAIWWMQRSLDAPDSMFP